MDWGQGGRLRRRALLGALLGFLVVAGSASAGPSDLPIGEPVGPPTTPYRGDNAFGRIDGDSLLDLVSTFPFDDASPSAITLYRQTTPLQFSRERLEGFAREDFYRRVAIFDFNGDGLNDLALGRYSPAQGGDPGVEGARGSSPAPGPELRTGAGAAPRSPRSWWGWLTSWWRTSTTMGGRASF